MYHEFVRYNQLEKLFRPGDNILLAVSGGMDSCAMVELFHLAGIRFGMAHCNFQLRGEESDRDEQFVRHLAEKYHVPCFVRNFDTRSFALKNKLSIQMAARKLRYEWFDELLDREGYLYVATAHHLDDQIETFLINLSRGTGISGLHGILPRQGRIIRPLLFASRHDLEEFAREKKVEYVEDSSNASLKYARNRIRLKIIPQFERIHPSFRENAAATIERIKAAESIYYSILEKERKRLLIPETDGFKIPLEELKKLSPLKTWLFELLSDFSFASPVVEEICASLEEQSGKVFYSRSHRLVKDRDFILITPCRETDTGREYEVFPSVPGDLPINMEFRKESVKKIDLLWDEKVAVLDYDKLQFPLRIRRWHKGDYFFPLGMKQRKKLSDFFTDMKFSIPDKENVWILCSGDDIAWIIGVRIDDRFKITSSTRNVLQVRILKRLPQKDDLEDNPDPIGTGSR